MSRFFALAEDSVLGRKKYAHRELRHGSRVHDRHVQICGLYWLISRVTVVHGAESPRIGVVWKENVERRVDIYCVGWQRRMSRD